MLICSDQERCVILEYQCDTSVILQVPQCTIPFSARKKHGCLLFTDDIFIYVLFVTCYKIDRGRKSQCQRQLRVTIHLNQSLSIGKRTPFFPVAETYTVNVTVRLIFFHIFAELSSCSSASCAFC